jgi:hypothetical protein
VTAVRFSRILVLLVAFGPATVAAGGGLRFETAITIDAAEQPLRLPEGVACDGKGAVVVADTGNARLVTYSLQDGAVRGGAELKLAQMAYPVRVQLDRKGGVLVLDGRAKRILRIDANRSFAGWVEIRGATTAPGTSIVPTSFKLDAADDLVVLDGAANRVLFVRAGGELSREVPLPAGVRFADVAVDAVGRVYGVDPVSATVWVVEKDGKAFQQVGSGLKDRMSFPTYVTAHGGRLIVVDQHGSGVVVLGQDGKFQQRELGFGWKDGALQYPAQLCIGADEALIADRDNNRVQVFAMGK